jgi:hypothetical protein
MEAGALLRAAFWRLFSRADDTRHVRVRHEVDHSGRSIDVCCSGQTGRARQRPSGPPLTHSGHSVCLKRFYPQCRDLVRYATSADKLGENSTLQGISLITQSCIAELTREMGCSDAMRFWHVYFALAMSGLLALSWLPIMNTQESAVCLSKLDGQCIKTPFARK